MIRIDAVRAAVILAAVLSLGTLLYAGWLEANDADAYYRASQEDELLEWGSFWAFLLAAVWFAWAAVRERRAAGTIPWFYAGVSLFCFVVAMEEISWGQRVLGYRPPDYFLAENFQQELNFHNVMDTGLRKLVFKLILLGYGVLLPLIMLWPAVGTPLRKLGIRPPHLGLALTFAASVGVYHWYPWSFTGEWIEMVAGFGFLFAGYVHCVSLQPKPPRGLASLGHAAVPALVALVLAAISTAALRHGRGADPEVVATAEAEIEALLQDFRSGELASKCGIHRRLYTYVEKYDQDYLMKGRFASLTAQGLPESRARYLLDPWNTPYWLRHRCSKSSGKQVVFVYSFGPNRGRDSNKWEILGDDIGVYIYRSD